MPTGTNSKTARGVVGAEVDFWKEIVDGLPTDTLLYAAFCEGCGWFGGEESTKALAEKTALKHDETYHSKKNAKR